MSIPLRSLRLLPKDISELDRVSGFAGEIFYDKLANTIRVFDGTSYGGTPLLKADLSNIGGGGSSGNNVDFGTRTVTAEGFIGTISDISNHALDELSNVNVASAVDGQVLYYNGASSSWEALTLSSSFNGGSIANALHVLATTASTGTSSGSLILNGGAGIAGAIHIGSSGTFGTSISATTSGSFGTTLTAGTGLTVTLGGASITGNSTVTGTLTATAGLTVNTGPVAIRGNNRLRLYDTDNTNFIGLRSPTNLTADVTYQLPGVDGSSGQVLTTNGLGVLSWATVSGGGGGGTSNPPGGANADVQFNNNGAFGGVNTFTYNSETDLLTVTNISMSGDFDGAASATITDIASLAFSTGATVETFDTDIALTSNSDTAVPTQAAVKSYIDNGLGLKATIDSPTFTGTVGGIDSTMVGLGNVENTAISTWSGSSSITTVGTLTNLSVAGNISVPTTPSQTTHATNKRYVDSRAIAMSIALS